MNIEWLKLFTKTIEIMEGYVLDEFISKNIVLMKISKNIVLMKKCDIGDEEHKHLDEPGFAWKRTMLARASAYGCLEMVKYLVECNANIGARDCERWTPVMLAVRYGHMEIAQFLVETVLSRSPETEYRSIALADFIPRHNEMSSSDCSAFLKIIAPLYTRTANENPDFAKVLRDDIQKTLANGYEPTDGRKGLTKQDTRFLMRLLVAVNSKCKDVDDAPFR